MNGKTKLELTWIGKEDRPRLEPRILIEQPEHSMPATDGTPDNILIHGDNLLALKALEGNFTGKVTCAFIDPPYNTGSAFTHYDDGVEHSLWLSLMRDRLELIRSLLAPNGSLWVTIDDNEAHYLKVILDEVFGRRNFVANVVWQKKYSKQNDAKYFSTSHDHILVYAKSKDQWTPNHIERTEDQLKGYDNKDDDPRGLWQSVVYTCAKTRAERPNLYYAIKHPRTGALVWPSENRVWGYDQKKHEQHIAERMLWWGKNMELEKPRLKAFLSKVGTGLVPDTLWLRSDAGDNQDAKREVLAFNEISPFDTPKPEKLIERILKISTAPGDLVLDSFAGSGTTGAVAQKMKRRWIMVEGGEHIHSHVVPRLRKVAEGSDLGGVTETTGWTGGGGFRFYRLAPSMLERDRWGNWVVSKDYNPAMLAEAMCRHMAFTYAPSRDPAEYWKHGYSTERDFIYVTTQALTHAMLAALSNEVGPDRRLLVCCKAFSGKADAFDNLTIRKIPTAVLANCEWGRDDYSLRITAASDVSAPEPTGDEPEATGRTRKAARRPRVSGTGEPGLFDVTSDAVEG